MALFESLSTRCQRTWRIARHIWQESPAAVLGVVIVLATILSAATLFSMQLSRVLGRRGTAAVDVVILWLFARLVARALMFPGSFKLFQRNTEATFRTEIARRYAHHLRQLLMFVKYATGQHNGPLRGVSPEGVLRGCSVIGTLFEGLRLQLMQTGKLTKEQELIFAAARDVDQWIRTVNVKSSGPPGAHDVNETYAQERNPSNTELLPLVEWFQQQHDAPKGFGSYESQNLLQAVLVQETRRVGPDAGDITGQRIKQIEELFCTMEDLRDPGRGVVQNSLRFLRAPSVGSLGQLKAELLMHYGGEQCWVPVRGRGHLDAMLLPRRDGVHAEGRTQRGKLAPVVKGPAGEKGDDPNLSAVATSGSASRLSGPVVVLCNPNAAYYETTIYQKAWLEFWLSRGCNVFVFNYAGYGRSSGKPSPGRLAEDGDAVVDYLIARGATKLGVYGRSIGGVAACHMARSHPEVVELLVVDRSMSTLEAAAKHIYGGLAARGLWLTRMTANNVDNFCEARCHKVMLCDPKDAMIVDMAALRTGVALRALEDLPEEERLPCVLRKGGLLDSLMESWNFILELCDDEGSYEGAHARNLEAAELPWLQHADAEAQAYAEAASSLHGDHRLINMRWLKKHRMLLWSTMAPLLEQVRSAMELVGEGLDGAGLPLSDVFYCNPDDPLPGLDSLFSNLQVWGSWGSCDVLLGQDAPYAEGYASDGAEDSTSSNAIDQDTWRPRAECSVSERDVERLLSRGGIDGGFAFLSEPKPTAGQYERLEAAISPEVLADYGRWQARRRVAHISKELRRRIQAIKRTAAADVLGSSSSLQAGDNAGAAEPDAPGVSGSAAAAQQQSDQANSAKACVVRALLHHVDETQKVVTAIGRFFQRTQVASQAAAAMTFGAVQEAAPAQKQGNHIPIDHKLIGYTVHIDVGHNGMLEDADLRQLSLHLRHAGFACAGGGSCR